MTAYSKPPVITDIISQHAEEASFLWLLRDSAVRDPHYSLKDLAELDERVEAHVDGLRIAGEAGWGICQEQLAWEEPGEVFAAAVLAFEVGRAEYINEVIETGTQSLELARGVVSALGWLTYEQAQPHIQALYASEDPMQQRIGVAAAAVHRHDLGKSLNEAVRASEPIVRARALRAVGELGRSDLLGACKLQLDGEDKDCRFWAAWAAARLGDSSGFDFLKEVVRENELLSERAADVLARCMNTSEALTWQRILARDGEHLRIALKVAGAIGDPESIPWIVEMMKAPESARIAGEAFTMITGVDIADDDLEGEWPENFKAGPTEDAEDDDIEMDPDEDLPWPEVELIQKWWQGHQGQFQKGTRYLTGKPISTEWLPQVLREGLQRQRAAAALELALLQPGQPLFEVRARGNRQQALLNR
jgi:uncharacterized protein (TIGR02270 family)